MLYYALIFRAVLSSKHKEQEVQQNGTFVTNDEPTLSHDHHSKSMVMLRFSLGLMHSVGFHKCIMMYIHHDSII